MIKTFTLLLLPLDNVALIVYQYFQITKEIFILFSSSKGTINNAHYPQWDQLCNRSFDLQAGYKSACKTNPLLKKKWQFPNTDARMAWKAEKELY